MITSELIRFDNPYFVIIFILITGIILFNGYNDVSNAIATSVYTRVISPLKALIISSIFNALGIIITCFISPRVISTIYNMVDLGGSNDALIVVLAALVSMILWIIISSLLKIATSMSYSLIAALTGASVALSRSFNTINADSWIKVISGLFLSILLGCLLGYLLTKFVRCTLKNKNRKKMNKVFKKLQIMSSAGISFMHGAQDGQKFIGLFLISISILNSNYSKDSSIPIFIMLYVSCLMIIGSFIGVRKTIKNLSTKTSKLELYQGACSDFSTAFILLFTYLLGMPVSMTQTKSSSLVGVSSAKSISSVRWLNVRNMLVGWLVTFPCCIILGYLISFILINIL